MLYRFAVVFAFVVWCLFADHGKLGNLLKFIGGALFAILSLGAALVRTLSQ